MLSKIFAISFILIGALCGDSARGQPLPAQVALKADLDSFFKRVGFEDYSAHIKDSLEKGRALNVIGVNSLEINSRRYAMLNHARQLAVIMLAHAYPRLRDKTFRKKFLAFSARLLTLKPLAPPLDIPQDVKAAGVGGVDSYLEKCARENMRRQTAAILSEYLDACAPRTPPPQERGLLSDLMSRYVMRMYLDAQIGNTQWLGRALLLGLIRYSNLYDDRLFADLKTEVENKDLFIENYAGSTLVLAGKDGRRRVKIETGDFIFERSRDTKESAAITAAALPQDEKTASRLGLLGSLLDAYWDVSPEARAMGLTRILRQKIITAQTERFSNGMTHIAQLAVYRDDRTGVEQTLIWDDYPFSVHLTIDKDEEWGGIRLNGFEHFANPGDVMRVGVVTLNKEKLFHIAKSNLDAKKIEMRDRGWNKYAWESYIPKISTDREILPQENPVRRDWEYQISQKDFLELHGTSDQKEWLKKYRSALLDGWKVMLTEWGIWFNWIDAGAGLDGKGNYQPGRYWFGGMYCSQAVNSASLLFAGLNLEIRPSHYARYLGLAQRLGIKKAKQLDLRTPVLAPSSLAVQPYSNPLIQVIYPPYSLTALARYNFESQPAPCSSQDENLIPGDLFNEPLNKGESEALVARERKFIEYVNLEKGKNMNQIFGKGWGLKKTGMTALMK